MPDPLPSDAIKPEVRRLSAYTLKHLDAGVKLDQNENPYELPMDLKQEVVDRILRRSWGRYPEFVPAAVLKTLAKYTGWREDGTGKTSAVLRREAELATADHEPAPDPSLLH